MTLQQIRDKHQNATPTRTLTLEEIQNKAVSMQEPQKRSFGEKTRDFAGGALYGFSSPGRTIQNMITKGANKLFNTDMFRPATKEGFESSTGVDLDTTSGKVGQFAGEASTFLAPGAIASKATRGAGLLTKAAAQGSAAFGQEALNTGDVGRAATAGVVGGGIPIAGRAAQPLLNYGKSVLKGLAGSVSGVGGDAVERAFQNPTAARQGMKATDEASLKTAATAVRQGVKSLKEKASAEYEKLTSKVTKPLNGAKLKQDIRDYFVDEVDAVPTKEGLRFSDTPLLDAEERQLEKVYNVVKNWTDYSPKGINTLATKISRFRRGSTDSKNFDLVVDNLRRNVRSFVGDEVPEIAEANLRFSDKMDLIDELDSILKTRGSVDSRQGIRETSQRIARLFNANKELSRQAVDELEKEIGVDTLAMEAGRQLSDNASLFQVGASDGVMSLVRTLVPRRVIGSIVTRTGQVNETVEQILGEGLSRLDEPARAVFIESLTNLFSQEENLEDQ